MNPALLTIAFLALSLPALPASAPQNEPSPDTPIASWVRHRVTIPAASQVDLSHLGVHTHANFIRFATGSVDVGKMQADQTLYRNVHVTGHCRLPTDRAALPPGFESLLQQDGPVPTSGPIDGSPGWSYHPADKSGHHQITFSVPTRFANWVACQPPALRHRYKALHSYSLEITWEERGGGVGEGAHALFSS